MDPASREGEGRGWGGRRRQGPGSFFTLAASSLRFCGRPRRELGAGRRSQPGPGPARATAGGTGSSRSPRRLAPELRRGPAAGPDQPSRRAEDPRPTQALSVGAARPDRRDERLWRHCFGRERAGPTRFAPPESPRMRDLEGGGALRLEGAKMALGLAHRQGWWRSCSAGAIFPGGAGGALRGRFSGPGAGRARATASHAWGAEFCKWGRSRGRGRLALAFPVPPDPKDEEAGPEQEGTRAGGVLLLSTCVGGKKWAWGRTLRPAGSLSEPADPLRSNLEGRGLLVSASWA